MKKTSMLKIVGALLIGFGAFFTPLTSIAKAGRQACLPEGSRCSVSGPRCCAGSTCWKGVCRDAV
jgi:hypothetical protein